MCRQLRSSSVFFSCFFEQMQLQRLFIYMRNHRLIPLLFLLAFGAFSARAAERKEVRVLYDFEDPAELKELESENIVLDLVNDNGVTRGKNCGRFVVKQGADYAAFFVARPKLK